MSSTRPTVTTPEAHYLEAQRYSNESAYIGSISDPKSPITKMIADIEKHPDKKDSSYFGAFFYPDQDIGGKWTYEKNKAFMAGAIDAGRTFILVTDIVESYNGGKPGSLPLN